MIQESDHLDEGKGPLILQGKTQVRPLGFSKKKTN